MKRVFSISIVISALVLGVSPGFAQTGGQQKEGIGSSQMKDRK
jgi:hypothetical protein